MPGVRGLVSKFERQIFSRVVMSGHGSWWPTDGTIKVPDGVTIHFYVAHGSLTQNSVGMAIENKFASTAPPQPVESIGPGKDVQNDRLSFASRLDLAGNLSPYKYDWITVNQVDRFVPLSVLLKDPRCKSPCEIHWAACREVMSDAAPGKGGIRLTRDRAAL